MQNLRLNKLQLVALLALLFATAFAMAQGIVTGSISGMIEDAQGAVVTNAKITAKEVATNRVYTGDSSNGGIIALRSLPPGTYDVTVEAPSFRKYENKGVVVAVGSETSLGRVRMEIGSAAETVTVEGTAPLVDSSTVQISQSFDAKQAQDLPVGNTFDSLALFAPGVASSGDAGFSNNNGAELAVNGQRSRSNNFQIDGQNNNDNSIGGPSIFFGNQDAIAEVQVVTNFSAEYGRNMGAVVNYVTKSGSNAFHGTGYEIYQGSLFDSLENQEKNPIFGFCAPGESGDGCIPPKITRFVDNRFGGSVGGPILRNRLWFFGSTNFERQRSAGSPSSTAPTVVPTANGIQQLLTAFPNSPGVKALAQFGPGAVKGGNPTFANLQNVNISDGTTTAPIEFGELTRNVPALFNDYEATGRVDWKVTNKDNFFGRYVFQQQLFTGISGNGIPQGDWVDLPGRDQQIGLDWVRNFNINFVNQVRFSYSRAGFGFEGGSFPACTRANILNCPTQISLNDPTIGTDALGNPISTISPFGRATNLPQGRTIKVYQVQDNASWQLGKMSLKIGGEYDKQNSPNVFLPDVNGAFVFNTFTDFIANNSFQDNIVIGDPTLPFTEHDLAFYIQDDWRIKDNLTLGLGLRWEWSQQAINLLHDRTVAQQTGPNPFWDPTLPINLTTVPRIPEDWNNFSPIIGFSWTPRIFPGLFGQDKTVVRGGFRIGYDPSFYNMFLNVGTGVPVVLGHQFPVNVGDPVPGLPNGSSFNGTDIRAALQPLVPTGSDPGFSPWTTVANNFHNPYSQQWNFGVQRSISSRVVTEIRYVGNHTVGNFQSVNGNPALGPLIAAGFQSLIPAGLTPCADPTKPGFAAGYVDCNKTRVFERRNSAFSKYHALQTELRVGGWHGVTATASYTYSKTIDNASEVFSTAAGGNTVSFGQNPFDTTHAESAVSGIDFPHLFGLAFIYDLPFQKGQKGLLGHVLGGWELNSTYRYSSGQPYTIKESKRGSALCDPTSALSGTTDACRPILLDATQPINTVGFDCNGGGGCLDSLGNPEPLGTLISFADPCRLQPASCGGVTPITSAHWLVNDGTTALLLGSPFLGVPRNTLRGQTISTANLGVFKNTKIGEKLTLQFQLQAFNVLNHQFLGVPDPNVSHLAAGTFENLATNINGGQNGVFGNGGSSNATNDGIGRRRLQFGLKLLF